MVIGLIRILVINSYLNLEKYFGPGRIRVSNTALDGVHEYNWSNSVLKMFFIGILRPFYQWKQVPVL